MRKSNSKDLSKIYKTTKKTREILEKNSKKKTLRRTGTLRVICAQF